MDMQKIFSHFKSKSALARQLGIEPQAVQKWKRMPVKRAVQIERLTNGKFRRAQMRPDIFGQEPEIEEHLAGDSVGWEAA